MDFSWKKNTFSRKIENLHVGEGGHIPMHMFIGGLGEFKVDCKLLYMYYSGSIQ